MTLKKLLLLPMMAMMAALLGACSDKDEPVNTDTVNYEMEVSAKYRDFRLFIEFAPYGNPEEMKKMSYEVIETGNYVMEDGKYKKSRASSPDNWVEDVMLTYSHLFLFMSPNFDDNRYAVINITFVKEDDSLLNLKITLYQEGKKLVPGPEGIDLSYSFRLSVIGSDGSDLLDPSNPLTICGTSITWDHYETNKEYFSELNNLLIDETTGRRYITIERAHSSGDYNLGDEYTFKWVYRINTATIEVSEATADGCRTYSINGGEPQPLTQGGLITLVTRPAEALHYKPFALPIEVVDVNGYPTDRLYLTATGADCIEHTAQIIPDVTVYSHMMAPGASLETLLLMDKKPEINFYGLFVPDNYLTLSGSHVNYKKGSLYAIGQYDSTKPIDETFTVKMKSREGDLTNGTYTIRIVNTVKQIGNYKESSIQVFINDLRSDFGINGHITLREQTAKD